MLKYRHKNTRKKGGEGEKFALILNGEGGRRATNADCA